MEIEIPKKYRLQKLQQILNYELSSSILLIFSMMSGFLILLLIGAAIIFTPYMLKVLFEERRYGWIIFFCIIVILPLITVFIIDMEVMYKTIFQLVILSMFYFYCFLLRLAIREW